MIVGGIVIIHAEAFGLLESAPGRRAEGIDVQHFIIGALSPVVIAKLEKSPGEDQLGLDLIDIPQVLRGHREIVTLVAGLKLLQHFAEFRIDLRRRDFARLGEGDHVREHLLAFRPFGLGREDFGVAKGSRLVALEEDLPLLGHRRHVRHGLESGFKIVHRLGVGLVRVGLRSRREKGLGRLDLPLTFPGFGRRDACDTARNAVAVRMTL